MSGPAVTAGWWRDAVMYHIYVRSFADSNGDGVGDLRGVIQRLDHLAWLGVDVIWLSPVMPSPNADWGYDVADYRAIDPELGTLDDFDELIAEAAARDIRVLNDLVPNHTSDQHPWFEDARSSRDSRFRNYYVWADPAPDGGPPNNWTSTFGGPAWTLDETTGQYYLHNFLPQQPDLNWWWEPKVAEEFDDILRFWFDRGVAGFRIDVCHMIVKDAELRDNPPLEGSGGRRGQQQLYNTNRPEVHEVLRRWRSLARAYDPERVLVGETFFREIELLPLFYGSQDDELHLAFNIPFIFSALGAELAETADTVERLFPRHAWPAWVGSNHDVSRFPTRWAGGDERKTRLAIMILLTLRGTPFLYYGDEIGMEDRPFEREEVLDPVGARFYPFGRDPERTPMQWDGGPGAGFTSPGARPWLPFGDSAARNVSDQRGDPSSVLHLTRDLIELRRKAAATYERISCEDGLWIYGRGGGFTVALNMSDDPATIDLPGTVDLSTSRTLDGQSAAGLSLPAWEGVVVSS